MKFLHQNVLQDYLFLLIFYLPLANSFICKKHFDWCPSDIFTTGGSFLRHIFIHWPHLVEKQQPSGGFSISTGVPSILCNLSFSYESILGIDFNSPLVYGCCGL